MSDHTPETDFERVLHDVERIERRSRARSLASVAVPIVVAAVVLAALTTRLDQREEAAAQAERRADAAGKAGSFSMSAPALVDFGSRSPGTAPKRLPVPVTNTGAVSWTVDRVDLEGDADFRIATDGCERRDLAPQETCRVEVEFAPRGGGRHTATLRVAYQGVAFTTAVALVGNAGSTTTTTPPATTISTAPASSLLRLEPSSKSISFDRHPVGTTSRRKTLHITNRGSRPAVVTGVALGGDSTGDFLVSPGDCTDREIPPGGRCRIDVVFQPQDAGKRSASLRIWQEGATTPLRVPLEGTGSEQGPD